MRILTACSAILLLSACNTIGGIGQDMSHAGNSLTGFAREVRGENTQQPMAYAPVPQEQQQQPAVQRPVQYQQPVAAQPVLRQPAIVRDQPISVQAPRYRAPASVTIRPVNSTMRALPPQKQTQPVYYK